MNEIIVQKPFCQTGFIIKTNDIELADTFRAYYQDIIVQNNIPRQECNEIEITKRHDGFIISTDKISACISDPIAATVSYIYENSYVNDGYFIMHAGVVIKNNKAYLLTAPSGTGKSTLICYLHHKGFDCVTDDYAVINKSSCRLIPINTSIRLRENGLLVLNKLNILPKTRNVHYKGFERFLVDLPPNKNTDVEIGGILWMSRERNNNVHILQKKDALSILMKSAMFPYDINCENIAFINKLMGYFHGIVVYKDMQYIVELLQSLNI